MRHLARSLPLAAFAVLIAGPAQLAADDWPGLLGPHHTLAVSPGLGLEDAAAVAIEEVWRRPFGPGYSSVAIADGVAVSMASAEDGDYLEAFDPKTGATRWRRRLGPAFLGRSGSDDGPLATPAIADGRVFALAPRGTVLAVDLASGERRWQRDLVATANAEMPLYGFSTALAITGDVVVVPVGRHGVATVAGLDVATGEVRWTAGSDRLGYQNPVPMTLAGRDQVVISSNEKLWGIDPATGTVLWHHDLGFTDDTGHVVPIDGDRFLYSDAGTRTFMARVTARDGVFAVVREWHQPVLKRSHGIPVYRDGHLYGFDGRFLQCVSAADGEVVWKSRPPGGQIVAMVDDLLVLWDNDGAVVAVEATPEGYRQRGRAVVAAPRRNFTPLSFADGLLLGRDARELFALRLAGAPAPEAAGTTAAGIGAEAGDEVERQLAAIERAAPATRSARVDRLLAAHPRLPIVTAAGRVHFLYRGAVDDLAIQGDMTGRWPEAPMRRLAGTDLFHRAYDLPAGERWEYRYKVFEETVLDPANPATVEGPDGAFSVVARGWAEAELPPAVDKGRLERVEVGDDERDEKYVFRVYLPPGYDREPERRYPAIVFALGEQAIGHGRAVAIFDSLGGVEFEPVIAVFLELPAAVWWDQNREGFLEIMRDLVLPRLEADYRLRAEPSSRAFVTRGWSTETALALVFDPKRAFGKVAIQSPLFGHTFLDRNLASWLRAAGPKLELYIDHGTYDGYNPSWPADIRTGAPALAERFRAAGHAVAEHERAGGHNWASWRTHTATILTTFFPLDGSPSVVD